MDGAYVVPAVTGRMDPLHALVVAVWVMLPAYIPNNVAVLAGGGRPIDGGRHWGGRRILGDGKTWRGTLVGVAAGIVVAVGLNTINGTMSDVVSLWLPSFSWAIVVAFPAGALLGDMTASFLKRRTGRERGAAFPVVDQLDFVVMALLLGAIVDLGWMQEVFTPLVLGIVVILTPVLHVGTNVIAYQLDLKDEPW